MELLMITDQYPYNYGDAVFIKPEAPFLSESFDKVHVMNTSVESFNYEKAEIPENMCLIPPELFNPKYTGKHDRFRAIFSSFLHPFKLSFILFTEIIMLIKRKKINKSTFKTAIVYLLNANLLSIFIKNYLLNNPEIKLIYTYWYKNETLTSIICKKCFKMHIKCITRTHGYDLYEFRQENNYQPYKIWMGRFIDKVYFASQAGYEYYIGLFAGKNRNKYTISKLGIENDYLPYSNHEAITSNKHLSIVSCSNTIPVKRVNLIIDALSEITDLSIKWIHIGDGPEKSTLENQSKMLLENKINISYVFKGHMDNKAVKCFYYENYFDCFISTTATEGGNPVSMMEAISFGIPVIASAVGGVPEIVNDSTGILLNPDNCTEELMSALYRFSSMPITEKKALRLSCRKYWEDNYMAEKQYSVFVNDLLDIVQQ